MIGKHGGKLNEPWLIDALDKFFRNQHIAECVAAESRHKQKEHLELLQDRRAINGLGQPKYEFDEAVLAHWRVRLGHNPLKDSGWKKWMEKHHADLIKVKSKGTKEIMVGYGSMSCNAPKRFTKKY